MEVEKQAFSGLMEYYKLLPTQTKRDEIVGILEELISNYSKICTKFAQSAPRAKTKEKSNVRFSFTR